jgi:hypothetical protein
MSANYLNKPCNKHRRFFYHYNKQKKRMTLHWKGACIIVDELVCMVPAETKTAKTQPRYVLQGWAKQVAFETLPENRVLAYVT